MSKLHCTTCRPTFLSNITNRLLIFPYEEAKEDDTSGYVTFDICDLIQLAQEGIKFPG